MLVINSGFREADAGSAYLRHTLRTYEEALRDRIAYHHRMICRALDGADTGLDLPWHEQERDRLTRELIEIKLGEARP